MNLDNKTTITINLYKVSLEPNIHGLSCCRSGAFEVFVNDTLSEDQQAAAFLHECLHIWHEDFSGPQNVSALEYQRHEEMKRIARILADE